MLSDVRSKSMMVDGQKIDKVVAPDTVEELCELLAKSASAGASILVCGGGTRLAFGNAGGPFDVAISTARLNHILHYEPDDLTLAVEPGCTIAQIHELLATDGQVMALDAAHEDRSTIGGAFATGMSGPRRLGGGSLKDWAIGIEVAGLDGLRAKAGGMVVKNVTGFDMMHVHYGALGAFGVVTRLNLKVFPWPGATRSLRMRFSTAGDAHAAGVALLASQLQPSSLLVSSLDAGVWSLDARIDAPPAAVDRLVERFVQTVRATADSDDIEVTHSGSDATERFVAVTDLDSGDAVVRLSIPASRQAVALEQLNGERDVQVCADLGSGLVYARSSDTVGWHAELQRVTAQPVLLAWPAEMKADVDVFGAMDQSSAAVVRRLKESFDPGRQLNRGRFVLGL